MIFLGLWLAGGHLGMWTSGVLASFIPGSCLPELPVQPGKAFFFFVFVFVFFLSCLLPPALSLLYFCQRSQKCHCGVVQSHQSLSKTICMHGPCDFCWRACGDGGPRGIWRQKGGCCASEESLYYEVRTQAGGPGSAAAQASLMSGQLMPGCFDLLPPS